MFVRFIHICIVVVYNAVYIYLSIILLMDTFGLFPVFTVINNASVNISCTCSLNTYTHFYWVYISEGLDFKCTHLHFQQQCMRVLDTLYL